MLLRFTLLVVCLVAAAAAKFNFGGDQGPCIAFDQCTSKRGQVPFYKLVVGDVADDDRDPSDGQGDGHQQESDDNQLPFMSTGCGSPGLTSLTDDPVVTCCAVRDACYSTCNITRPFCDGEFSKCLRRTNTCRKGDRQCAVSLSQMESGAKMFGCDVYKKAQHTACSCVSTSADAETPIAEHHLNFWKQLYSYVAELYPEAAKTDAQIEAVAAKALEGKRPAVMVYRVLEKYPKLVRFGKHGSPRLSKEKIAEIQRSQNKDL